VRFRAAATSAAVISRTLADENTIKSNDVVHDQIYDPNMFGKRVGFVRVQPIGQRPNVMDPPKEQPWNGKRARLEPTPATSSDGCQSTRLQPSAEHEGHSQRIVRTTNGSTRQDILTDLVQNTAEYSGRVADLLSFRGVSTKWQSAVCDALGYLNGRCWTRFALGEHNGALWASLRVDDAILVARCAVLCLRPRLETVEWIDNNASFQLPLQLFGENNTTLTTLNLDAEKLLGSAQLRELRGLKQMRLRVPDPVVPIVPIVGALATLEVLDLTSHPVTDLKGLQGLVSLRALTLSSTLVTNEHFAGLENVLAGLHTLDLSWCEELTMISNIAACVSLRQLNLAWSGVEDLQGLERLVALETLDISSIPARDWCILRQCPQLAYLTAGAYDYVLSTSEVQAMVDNAAHCLVKWVAERTSEDDEEARVLTDVRPASFLRCTVLRELDLTDSDVDNSAIHVLAEIPALERLTLYDNPVSDVRALAGCRAIRELLLGCTQVTNEGIVGLEQIVTLEKLDLVACTNLTAVTRLRYCAALRELNLGSASVTCAGIEGLECIATLTTLGLDDCKFITQVSTLQHSQSLRALDISNTQVTAAGIAGLEKIVTLECLDASRCGRLHDVITLRRCSALRFLDLSFTYVGNTSMASLACVATLESLWLARCTRVTDVSELSESASLDLDLMLTGVDDDGIVGLERIPTLTSLDLTSCVPVTNVRYLIRSKALRRLILSSSGVTDAGIVGIETAPALEFLELQSCHRISDVAAVEQRAAEHAVKLKT
jgi:Leucine-rich repeat (LRR) protein